MAKVFKFDELPLVETTGGKLRGYFFDKTYIFKGIPYAQAKRFQMPEEVKWDDVFEAVSYGTVSPMLQEDTPTGELFVPHRYWIKNENCQNLNIWTTSMDNSAKKPVLVWLHGGAFSAGSSIEHIAYDGANLCHNGDVVVVSINHRLNILGYLDLSPFGEKYSNSANAGHADMVAALKWINKNIAMFGGDPDNITIFGQSGGGMKCTGLMQIPEADGLFHKAIIMSGVSDGRLLGIPKDSSGKEIVEAVMNELKITQIEELETIPYYDLAQAYNKVSPAIAESGKYVGKIPMANDWYMGEPLITKFTEHAKTIPFVVGTVFGEFTFGSLPVDKTKVAEEETMIALTEKFGSNTAKLIELYKQSYPDKNLADLFALDYIFRAPSKALAKLAAKECSAPAYLYNFTLEFPDFKQNKIAWHCADIPFFFHNTDKVEVCNIPNVTEKLEAQIFGMVKAFAHTGNPNHNELPNWPAVTPECEATMIFDRECEVRYDYDSELIELLQNASPNYKPTPPKRVEDKVQH